jgi:hypothetical protein
MKGGDGYRVDPPVNVYVIRFLGDGKYHVESASGGTVRVDVAKESAVAVVASGAVYVVSNILKPGDLPQTIEKDSYCYVVHFEGSPCVALLKKEVTKNPVGCSSIVATASRLHKVPSR